MTKSKKWFEVLNRLEGLPLTSVTAGSAGTCAAKMFRERIELVLTTATDAKMATSTIETPVGFKVIDAKAYKYDGTKEATVIVKNGTNTLYSATLGTNYAIERASTMGTANTIYAGDDDLIATMSGSSLGSAIVVLDVVVV